MRGVHFALCLVFFLINTVHGLYEDQIGKFDWRQQYIGRVSHALFDSTGKKIIVGTDENIIASLHTGTGKIEWRHILGAGPKSKIHSLFSLDSGSVAIISGTPATVRVFDLTTGINQWETTVVKDTTPLSTKWAASSRDVVSVDINSANTGYELVLSEYSSASGAETVLPAIDVPWFSPASQCQLAYPYLLCLHRQDGTINVVHVKRANSHQRIPLADLGFDNAGQFIQLAVIKGFVWLKTAERSSIFKISEDGLEDIGVQLPADTLLVDVPVLRDLGAQQEVKYIAALVPDKEDYLIKIYNFETKQLLNEVSGKLKLPEQAGQPEFVSTYLMRKSGGELTYRFAISTSDDALHYGSKKEVYWTREESLTSIIQVEMVDLPVSSMEAAIEEEFGMDQQSGGIFGPTVKRITSQLRQLMIFARQLAAGGELFDRPSSSSSISSRVLERDRFGLHKLIIIITRPGKLFAMDTLTGRIVWKRFLKDINTDKLRLYVQRSSIHYPLEPQCTILAKNSITGEGVLYVFHPISGEPAEFGNAGYINLGYKVQQAMLLPQSEDTEYIKPLLFFDQTAIPHVFPSTQSILNQVVRSADNLFIFTADPETCLMRGYSLAKSTVNGLVSTPVWQLQLCTSGDSIQESIVSIASRHPEEKVHSQGRVLADRNVLYKYLNPNMVAVLTSTANHPQHRGILNLYLIDVVTGAVVFSASHRRVQPPYHLVYAENWVVYSYYNEKYRRTEISSLEFFEGPTQSNSTAFSSFVAPQPRVDRQAYIYPSHITAMKDTISEQGMTAKHILLGLPNGWIQELPRVFLDPRRPVVSAATPEMREEGIMPYLPELPIPAEAIINYNQTVSNVKNIYVAPSSLESTGLVLAYGLDIFFTHVTPSRTFDVLNDDFEYVFIALVLTGLTLASFISKKWASKKSLRQAWK